MIARKINNSWDSFLEKEFNEPYFKVLEEKIETEYNNGICFPKEENIFNAFKFTPLENIKVVILGQDPYHDTNQAMGLSFSVPDGVKIPPSLVNIYKELSDDFRMPIPKSGDLTNWTKEGVFLLNTTLTVRKDQALSHKGLGWEKFTDHVIKEISDRCNNVVFILWGGQAKTKEVLIDKKKHHIIMGVHPSPLSAYHGFFGSKPFTKANRYLMENEIEPVDWSRIL